MHPRLRTIAQLAETHVDAMRSGAFVGRGVDRWRDFESNASNQVVTSRTSDWTLSDDAAQAFAIARTTGAVVIQTAWRRFAAVAVRKRLTRALWKRQMRVASWVAAHYDGFRSQLERLEPCAALLPLASLSPDSEPNSVLPPTPQSRLLGAYYHVPASVLAMWLRLACARASGHCLRRSPAILETIDIPVRRTLRVAVRYWRTLTALAALRLQCCVRAHAARKRFRSIHTEFVRHRATLRLQCFFRVCLAQKLATRLRRRSAAVCIQCAWRCAVARTRVTRQRVLVVSQRVWTALRTVAVAQAAQAVLERAANTLQRVYRGQCARSRMRWLQSVQEQQRWLKNPSKGFVLFAKQQFYHAALCLEYALQQGYVRDLRLAVVTESQLRTSAAALPGAHPHAPSGSRMSMSFSSTPTPLTPFDWLQRSSAASLTLASGDASDTTKCLALWFVYAMSHFQVYDATGAVGNLETAQTGFERFLDVCETYVTLNSVDSVVGALRFEARVHLLRCLAWRSSDSANEQQRALALSQALLDEIESEQSSLSFATRKRASHALVLMTHSMLCLQLEAFAPCCVALEQLLALLPHPNYSELEVRFVLALVLSKRIRSTQADEVDRKTLAKEHRAAATAHLERCYQLVERWPGVGYFHGVLSSSDAKQRLKAHPVGAYLFHLPGESTTDAQQTVESHGHDDVVVLRVKLSDQPLRITSLRIERDRVDGAYVSKKIPRARYASLHTFVAHLPPAAGVCSEHGVRASHVRPALEKHAARAGTGTIADERSLRCKFLHWSEWMRQLRVLTTRTSPSPPKKKNETWAAMCFAIARMLESSDAYVFSAFVANEALALSRDRFVVASASFLLGRCARFQHQHAQSAWFLRLAALASDRGVSSHWQRTFRAVSRALSRSVAVSTFEPFASQLERVQKLERMCVRAWRFDSLSVSLRGDAFAEALLLQRIYDEMYATCADTFFLRSLLRAHVRAFVSSGPTHLETTHVAYALESAVQLFELFRTHHGDDGRTNASPLEALGALLSPSATPHRRHTAAFPVEHLLLIWHRMPFAVCFEIAEVLYRASPLLLSSADGGSSRVIDMYESLYGRLRGAKSPTRTYAAFEELVLVRLAFLYAQRATTVSTSGTRHLRSAVKLIDELLALRGRTSRRPAGRPRAIKWPSVRTLPSRLSTAELAFMRGFLLELLEDKKQTPREQRTSWQSYNVLHADLMTAVARVSAADAAAHARNDTQRLRGIRVYVGATQDVVIQDVLHSKPVVTIQCEGRTVLSQSAPTWMRLAPAWDEFIELDVASIKSRLVVSLVDRTTRRVVATGPERSLGSVHVYIDDVVHKPETYATGRYFALVPATSSSRSSLLDEPPERPSQLFLRFQAIFQPRDTALEANARKTRRTTHGNWPLDDVTTHLHGDLETFVRSRWVWSAFARLWLAEHEFAIASWFLSRAIDAAAQSLATKKAKKASSSPDALAYVEDLQALSECCRATMPRAHWTYYASPLLETADAVLQQSIKSGAVDPQDVQVQKLTLSLETSKRALAAGASAVIDPFARAMQRNTPASSDWVRIPVHREASLSLSSLSLQQDDAYFVNLDTGECVVPSTDAPCVEPLEYEDKDVLKRCNYEAIGARPHRIVVWSTEMKARVAALELDIAQRRVCDPFQWTAVFDTRRQQMQFFSLRAPRDAKQRVAWQQHAPPPYVMVADTFMLYHVLVVQDAYRAYCRRKRHRRKLRGVAQCTRWLAAELLAARLRIAKRTELERKRALNCLHVVVERARHLHAGDVFTSDPFVIATVLDAHGDEVAKGKTSVRHNTRSPAWHEEFAFHVEWQEFAGHSAATEAEDSECQDGEDEDESGDLLQHARGVLAFEVCDFDLISLRNGGDKKAKEKATNSSSDDSDREGDGDCETLKKGDVLGYASLQLEALEHGQPLSADLALARDVDATNGKASGSLSVIVHWTHSREFDDTDASRKRSSVVVDATKKPLPKQPLPDALTRELHDVNAQLERATEALLDLGASTLDPLQRLHKRMVEAQAVGRTAEEAKVVEQRMLALMKTQLGPKTQCLDERLRVCRDAVERFRQNSELLAMAREFVDSQETSVCDALTATLTRVLASVETATRALQSLQQHDASVSSSLAHDVCSRDDLQQRLGAVFAAGFQRRELLNAWRSSVETLTTAFFARASTPQSLVQTQTDELFSKLTAPQSSLGSLASAPAVSSDANAPVGAATSGAPVAKSTATSAAANKRLERIQREKQKRMRK